jgi:hypothetical protein
LPSIYIHRTVDMSYVVVLKFDVEPDARRSAHVAAN